VNCGARRSAFGAAEEHTEGSKNRVQSHAYGSRKDGLLVACLQQANHDMTKIDDVEDYGASQGIGITELISVA
jgi:hypothetical protein